MDRTQYYLHMNEPIRKDELAAYQKLAAERCTRIPLQYILGETEFMGLPFRVTPDVLIPRQDTEILVEEALARISPGMRVLDLCTGSGCIAVSLAKLGAATAEEDIAADMKEDADARLCVTASDISEAALAVARENARINEVQVSFVQSDLFSNIEGTFDMIVSNPPYIPADVIPGLEPEVAEHEPHGALDGGVDGLEFYRRIVAGASGHLRLGGWILFEIGCDQGEAVMKLLREVGYEEVSCKQDLAHLDRVVTGRVSAQS